VMSPEKGCWNLFFAVGRSVAFSTRCGDYSFASGPGLQTPLHHFAARACLDTTRVSARNCPLGRIGIPPAITVSRFGSTLSRAYPVRGPPRMRSGWWWMPFRQWVQRQSGACRCVTASTTSTALRLVGWAGLVWSSCCHVFAPHVFLWRTSRRSRLTT